MNPYYQDKWVTIYHGDCREILPQLDVKVDLVLTDPPYSDYHSEYGDSEAINELAEFNCRQLVFWSAKADFPLDCTAIHIWDKKVGAASQYERIFERNGQCIYKMYRAYLINSTVAASYTGDIYTGHASQKPQKLILKLIADYSNPNDLILDPFLGSGTTAYCAKKLNRRCIGIEIEEKYCEISANRCRQEVMELKI
ncbi:site-specific DNA-methyltransferase [Patescibacteria group bacterium]|nr:site-specific DNA-methyltransferase [Patescibacteria group bacterium]